MASTNKTTHYELNQYVASDKPTYLTDYNNDMSAIDTGMYNAQTKADSAYTLAGTADGKADTAITNAGTAQTDASTAITRIGTMANLDTTEKTNLVGAVNEVNYNVGLFNLTNYSNDLISTATTDSTQGSSIDNGHIYLATNANGSLAKFYGWIELTAKYNAVEHVIVPTTLRPSSEITIVGQVTIYRANATGASVMGAVDLVIKTNGNIEINYNGGNVGNVDNKVRLFIANSLMYIKDFGDEPTPQI